MEIDSMDEVSRKECQFCRELILEDAEVCRFCNRKPIEFNEMQRMHEFLIEQQMGAGLWRWLPPVFVLTVLCFFSVAWYWGVLSAAVAIGGYFIRKHSITQDLDDMSLIEKVQLRDKFEKRKQVRKVMSVLFWGVLIISVWYFWADISMFMKSLK